MRLHLLLFILLLFSILLSPVRSGLGPAEGHCLNLGGVCRRDVCKVTEDEVGACRRRMKCCRAWWIAMPIPTPVIMSDYQEPLKPKLK
ncbi:beta-defensin 109 [Sapajus apella]|uniref:Beta-defensin 109 n=1 Tax=Sapajus apella TaxID=9515 RepID=A0A6J3H345_SAPAP|nr:beta-defensin 109 [Sapajus apella]XP_032129469.1 beta-defensin 109 [Sapajus apella]